MGCLNDSMVFLVNCLQVCCCYFPLNIIQTNKQWNILDIFEFTSPQTTNNITQFSKIVVPSALVTQLTY